MSNVEKFGFGECCKTFDMIDQFGSPEKLIVSLMNRIKDLEDKLNKSEQKRPSNVRVIRHVRPVENGNVVSSHGITFVFDLDYDSKKVFVATSVCNGDNFSRQVGRDVAIARADAGEYMIDYQMPSNSDIGLVNNLMKHLTNRNQFVVNTLGGSGTRLSINLYLKLREKCLETIKLKRGK